jgi:hypothetical protein
MTHKIKFQNKTYTVIEVQDAGDPAIIKYRAKVKNSKGEEFTFVHSLTGFHLYNEKDQRIAETTSVQEWDV